MKKSVVFGLHIGYWACYSLLVTLILIMIQQGRGGQALPEARMIQVICSMAFIPALVGFYGGYQLIFPKFIAQQKYLKMLGATAALVVGGALLGDLGMSVLTSMEVVFNGVGPFIEISIFLMIIAVLNLAVGVVMKGFMTAFADIKVKEELNRQHFETEMSLVKSQINPHFLFNTINNIDVLIQKDADLASKYLNELSDIMRYMLHDTKSDEVELADEIKHLEKYIGLQKIRSANPQYVTFKVNGNVAEWKVAPMIFMPFVENAFKHASTSATEAIIVSFSLTADRLTFTCDNEVANKAKLSDVGGLGNELMKKRLSLLFTDKHDLRVSNTNDRYHVELTINK